MNELRGVCGMLQIEALNQKLFGRLHDIQRAANPTPYLLPNNGRMKSLTSFLRGKIRYLNIGLKWDIGQIINFIKQPIKQKLL